MVRHWNRELAHATTGAERRRIHRARWINVLGACFTGAVLVVVLVTKFTHGAYLVVIAIPLLYLMMRAIRRHYDRVREELRAGTDAETLPSRVHALVLVSTLHKPTLRAISFARATRPDTVAAITVNVDDTETRALQREWDARGMKIPLKVIESRGYGGPSRIIESRVR